MTPDDGKKKLTPESVAAATYNSWRLPTSTELQTILLAPNPCGTSPCIDPLLGPTNTAFLYLSSTTFAGDATYAWTVSFNDGPSPAVDTRRQAAPSMQFIARW